MKAGSTDVTSSSYRHILSERPHRLQSLDSFAIVTAFRRGQKICGQCCPADCWYCVISGVARRFVVRSDGHRQILDLLLPGDFFGFTASDEYDFTVEAAAEGTIVAGYPRRVVEKLIDSDPRLAREIREVTFEAISRLQAQLMIVGRITAPQKVGSFLVELAARMRGGPADQVVLPVSRYDIADYLTLSVETVSRSLSDLKHHGLISLSGTRRIRILNLSALSSD